MCVWIKTNIRKDCDSQLLLVVFLTILVIQETKKLQLNISTLPKNIMLFLSKHTRFGYPFDLHNSILDIEFVLQVLHESIWIKQSNHITILLLTENPLVWSNTQSGIQWVEDCIKTSSHIYPFISYFDMTEIKSLMCYNSSNVVHRVFIC